MISGSRLAMKQHAIDGSEIESGQDIGYIPLTNLTL